MQTNLRTSSVEPTTTRPRRKHTLLASLCYIGVVGIVGWSLPGAVPTGHRAQLAARTSDTEILDTSAARSTPVQVKENPRKKGSCSDCGVIESVRRIDRREEIMESCAIGDMPATRIAGNGNDGSERPDQMTLAAMVAGAIGGHHGAKKSTVTTRHQIVVRLPDGSSRVFNEETPRTLRVGDRIQVIAGAASVNNGAGEPTLKYGEL